MIQPLIFTEQRLFPRALDLLLTIIAWLGFCWLIYSGLINAIEHDPFMGTRPFYTTLSTLSIYLLVACLIDMALIGWAKYNQLRFRIERRKRRPELEHHEVAAFVGGLAAQLVQLELQTGIAAQFCVELEQLLAGGLDGQRIFGRVEVGVGIIDMGNGQIQRNMLLAAVF